MRSCLFAWLLGGLLLSGCNSASQPEASRGAPDDGNESPQTSQLPEGHPPMGHGMGDAEATLDDSGGEVKLGAVTLTAPEGWRRKQPQSTFIQAEFELPKVEGDEADGRLTVSTAGGSIEANIERWKGQFTDLGDSHQETIDVDGIEVTLVDLSGDFNDQRGPFAPAVMREDYRMIAAIIPVDGQLHFVKATGPAKTMEAHAEEIKNFVRTVERGE